MRDLCIVLGVVLGVCALFVTGIAGDKPDVSEDSQTEMKPQTQIEELAFLVGDWEVEGQTRFGSDCMDWTDFTASCHYEYIVDGAAIKMDHTSEIMNMPMHGFMLQTFDKQTDNWQLVWVDNLAGRITYYEGRMKKNKQVLTGSDMWNGEEFLSRMITSDITDTSFTWELEISRDQGWTWNTTMRAAYVKK